MSDHGLGRIGLWTFDLDMQPMSLAQEAVQRIEEMGFGTVWVPEAVGREPFASCSLLLEDGNGYRQHSRAYGPHHAGWVAHGYRGVS
jgi:hypothetical protein